MPVGIPPLIITLLVDTIKEEMDGEEGFLGFPKEIEPLLYEGKPDDTRRKMLKAMSLVCREWTKPAQDALRRRVFLQDVEGHSVSHLLDSGRCGPWVRELQYWEENTEHLHQKSTSLESLLIRLPNLTALSFGSNHLYPSGITHHLGSLPHLRALHIQCLLGRNNLPNIYSAVSNLHELDLLTLIGEWVHEEDSQSLAPELIGKHPPASLKMLLLGIEFSNGGCPTTDLLSWILQARDGYVLREVRLIVTISEEEEDWKRYGPIFLESLSSTLPSLKTLVLGYTGTFSYDVCATLLKCTSLEDLHLFDEPGFPLPPSLKAFCWGHDIYQIFSAMEYEDKLLSEYLRSQLASGKLPNLRFFHLSSNEEIDLYPQTREVCKEFDITFVPDCTLEGSWTRIK